MPSPSRWRFGPFEVDALEHQLRRDGEVVGVTRKSFALLATLLSRPGKLFTKAELFEIVWAGTVVTDAALSRAIHELRVALGDDAAAPRYIATAHGLGFRFVALVAVDRPSVDSSARAAALERRFVGRDSELALLGEALTAARAGRRQTVFVTGEAGIGKTALVEAFLRRPEVAVDVRTTQGRCVEQYGTGEAYLPILEALEHLAREVGADRMREVLLRYAPAWLAQLPWLALDADAESLRRANAEGNAHRMLREIAHALEVLASDRPVVVWLEDLHWSDPSSLAVIAFLAGRREPARLLLVASFRPADAQAGAAPLHGLALQLVQRGQVMPLALGLLDEAAIARYLRARFDNAAKLPFVALATFLHRRTDGNALFTVAMVDDLVRSGRVVEAEGPWTLRGSVAELGDGLPDDLRHLVHAQIERLDEDDRRLVEAAAVAGTDFAAAHVAAALQCDVAGAEDRCTRLALSGRFLRARAPLAWPDGTQSAGFGFLHALYWQATHERVPHNRRADWQRRIGLAQELAYGAQCADIAAELAMRFAAAGDTARSFEYSRLAGAGALARCAYGEGIEHMRRALALVERLPAAKRAQDELAVLLPLGAALMMAQGYASAEVEATYERALVLGRECGRAGDIERAQRGLWNVWFSRADLGRAHAAAEDLLARARARAQADDGLVFDALAKLGHTELHDGEFAAARAHMESALAMTDAGPAYRREAPRLLAYLSWVLWYLGLADLGDRLLGTIAREHRHRHQCPHRGARSRPCELLAMAARRGRGSGRIRPPAMRAEQRARPRLLAGLGRVHGRPVQDEARPPRRRHGGDARRDRNDPAPWAPSSAPRAGCISSPRRSWRRAGRTWRAPRWPARAICLPARATLATPPRRFACRASWPCMAAERRATPTPRRSSLRRWPSPRRKARAASPCAPRCRWRASGRAAATSRARMPCWPGCMPASAKASRQPTSSGPARSSMSFRLSAAPT